MGELAITVGFLGFLVMAVMIMIVPLAIWGIITAVIDYKNKMRVSAMLDNVERQQYQQLEHYETYEMQPKYRIKEIARR